MLVLRGSRVVLGGSKVAIGPRCSLVVLGGAEVVLDLTCLWSQLLFTTGALRFLLMELDLLPKLWIFLEEEREG